MHSFPQGFTHHTTWSVLQVKQAIGSTWSRGKAHGSVKRPAVSKTRRFGNRGNERQSSRSPTTWYFIRTARFSNTKTRLKIAKPPRFWQKRPIFAATPPAGCGQRPLPSDSRTRRPSLPRPTRTGAPLPALHGKPIGTTRLTSSRTAPPPARARARCRCAGGTRPRTRHTRRTTTPGPPRRSSRSSPARGARRRTAPVC